MKQVAMLTFDVITRTAQAKEVTVDSLTKFLDTCTPCSRTNGEAGHASCVHGLPKKTRASREVDEIRILQKNIPIRRG